MTKKPKSEPIGPESALSEDELEAVSGGAGAQDNLASGDVDLISGALGLPGKTGGSSIGSTVDDAMSSSTSSWTVSRDLDPKKSLPTLDSDKL